jgi:hypothetical protein
MAMSELFHVPHNKPDPFLKTRDLKTQYQFHHSTTSYYYTRTYALLHPNTQVPCLSYQIKKIPHRRHSRSTFIEILVVERTTLTQLGSVSDTNLGPR